MCLYYIHPENLSSLHALSSNGQNYSYVSRLNLFSLSLLKKLMLDYKDFTVLYAIKWLIVTGHGELADNYSYDVSIHYNHPKFAYVDRSSAGSHAEHKRSVVLSILLLRALVTINRNFTAKDVTYFPLCCKRSWQFWEKNLNLKK